MSKFSKAVERAMPTPSAPIKHKQKLFENFNLGPVKSNSINTSSARTIALKLFAFIALGIPSMAQAQQIMDTISVNDYWIRPGSFLAFSSPSGGGGGGSGESGDPAAQNQARQERCNNIRNTFAALKCAGKATDAPSNALDLNIPSGYSTSLIWGSNITAYATELFNNPGNTNAAREAGARAIRDSLVSCAGVIQCQNDVLQYFGVNRVTLPLLGSIGDINAAYNQLLDALGVGGNFASSPAGKIAERYYGLQVCNAIRAQAQNAQNRCGAL